MRTGWELMAPSPGLSNDRQYPLGRNYMRQKPPLQEKCRQQLELLEQEAPVPPQQTVSVPVPEAKAQILFVLSVQHC